MSRTVWHDTLETIDMGRIQCQNGLQLKATIGAGAMVRTLVHLAAIVVLVTAGCSTTADYVITGETAAAWDRQLQPLMRRLGGRSVADAAVDIDAPYTSYSHGRMTWNYKGSIRADGRSIHFELPIDRLAPQFLQSPASDEALDEVAVAAVTSHLAVPATRGSKSVCFSADATERRVPLPSGQVRVVTRRYNPKKGVAVGLAIAGIVLGGVGAGVSFIAGLGGADASRGFLISGIGGGLLLAGGGVVAIVAAAADPPQEVQSGDPNFIYVVPPIPPPPGGKSSARGLGLRFQF
jgi:hypothetical protein